MEYTVSEIISICDVYNNLDAKAVVDVYSTGIGYVATEKMCNEISVETNKSNSKNISVPVFKVKYKMADGKYLKINDVSLTEFNELRKRGLVIEEKTISERRNIEVYRVNENSVREYKLSMIDVSNEEIESAVESISMYVCKNKCSSEKISSIVCSRLCNTKNKYKTVNENELQCIIEVMNKVAYMAGQKYILDIKKEYYNEMISALLDDMESNYIKSLVGM